MTNQYPGRRQLQWHRIPFIDREFTLRPTIDKVVEIRRTSELDYEDMMITRHGFNACRKIASEKNRAKLDELRRDPQTRAIIDRCEPLIRNALDNAIEAETKSVQSRGIEL